MYRQHLKGTIPWTYTPILLFYNNIDHRIRGTVCVFCCIYVQHLHLLDLLELLDYLFGSINLCVFVPLCSIILSSNISNKSNKSNKRKRDKRHLSHFSGQLVLHFYLCWLIFREFCVNLQKTIKLREHRTKTYSTPKQTRYESTFLYRNTAFGSKHTDNQRTKSRASHGRQPES